MTKTYLGIDGGASSGKWCLIDSSGQILANGKSGPIDGHIYREESRARLAKFLAEINNAIQIGPSAAHVGLTGAPETRDAQSELRNLFSSVLGKINLEIENDVYLGYRAAFGKDQGVFLYSGTGSIAVYRDSQGLLRKVGGWGYLLGDEGGGYWIGREAIRCALFAIEDARNSEIATAVFKVSGGDSWDAVKRFVYSSSREQIATLAQPTLALAESGNHEANEIVIQAASHLAELVIRAERKLGFIPRRVILSGGVLSASKLISNEVEKALGRDVESFQGDSAFEAALVARQRDAH